MTTTTTTSVIAQFPFAKLMPEHCARHVHSSDGVFSSHEPIRKRSNAATMSSPQFNDLSDCRQPDNQTLRNAHAAARFRLTLAAILFLGLCFAVVAEDLSAQINDSGAKDDSNAKVIKCNIGSLYQPQQLPLQLVCSFSAERFAQYERRE